MEQHVVTLSSPCWEWPVLNADGYGITRDADGRQVRAHRVSFEAFVGPIPGHLRPDHVCRNRACVNPRHLELVTVGENTRRGLKGFDLTGYCRSGKHEITTDADVYVAPGTGVRRCAACKKERRAESAQRASGNVD